MIRELVFIVSGYLMGGILFARLAAALLRRPNVVEGSEDGNPGTANAFQYGGALCGVITLLGDLNKGFWPLYFYQKSGGNFDARPLLSALVLMAPVWGHAFPAQFHFQGGKGIAVTFGCLLGLCLATDTPLKALAFFFLFFSLVLRVSPNFYRTGITYLCALAAILLLPCPAGVRLGFLGVTAAVFLRLHLSPEKREKLRIRFLWLEGRLPRAR